MRLACAGSEMGEAIFTAKEINRLTGGIGMLEAQENFRNRERRARSFGEIAVLFRTHQEARLLETCLKKEGIPYVVAGREAFLKEDPVRGTIAFFRSLTNLEDPGERALSLKLLWNLPEDPMSLEIYEARPGGICPFFRKKLRKRFWKRGIGVELDETERDGEAKRNFPVLFYYGRIFKRPASWRESDLKRCGEKQYNGDAVTLTTLHGSKGLEFPAVILYGVRKGQIPFESKKHKTDLQEERRLFYVGLTRAKEELILTTSQEPSSFLENLPEGLLEREKTGPADRKPGGHQMSLFELEGFEQD